MYIVSFCNLFYSNKEHLEFRILEFVLFLETIVIIGLTYSMLMSSLNGQRKINTLRFFNK